MKFPAVVDDLGALGALKSELHLAIGVFDGVHLGHKAVIEAAVFSARRSGGIAGVLTFDPHPSRLFRPSEATRLIMPIAAKVEMLQSLGVNCVVCKRFDRDFASILAADFLGSIKQAVPALRSIYVGENFRFGQKRMGDVSALIESGGALGLGVISADRIKHNGEPVSSTRIRNELEAGEIALVNDLLGYNYTASGPIVAGAQLGRTLGFPTYNLCWEPECLPRFGVYAVHFRKKGLTSWLAGVANYGVKPTVAEAARPAIEVHSLVPSEMDVGDFMEVEWLSFLRSEQKFASVDALKAQIKRDCELARECLK